MLEKHLIMITLQDVFIRKHMLWDVYVLYVNYWTKNKKIWETYMYSAWKSSGVTIELFGSFT